MPFGETIAVIDKSGQVVSTSKHLFGVFSHAKNAYRERKAQVQSERNAKIAERIAEREALKALQNYTIDDAPSVASSRRSRSRHHHSGRSHYDRPRGGSICEQDLHSSASRARSRARSHYEPPTDMVRRHTHHDIMVREPEARPLATRSKSDAHVDMDLAYGEYNPEAMAPRGSQDQFDDPELSGLVNKAQWLLEEANCVQHTATATMDHLQKNPDAMAAVALTLAEISNVAGKMAPSALTMLKTSAPVIWGLLASPQFLIAAGVGLTATIVMFGGYKIVKQLQQPSAITRAPEQFDPQSGPQQMDEMIEFNTECLSSVEMWRRGVADAEAESYATSVDGEFITPRAAAMSGIDITTARMSRDPRFKFDDDESVASSRRSHRSRPPRSTHSHSRAPTKVDTRVESQSIFSRHTKAPPSKAPSKAPSRAPSRAPSSAESRHSDRDKSKKPKEKVKRSSRLRLMFTA
ncbi:hypothetical protein BDW74DRAFT_75088 [Aspergillus multicolor]|uniref:uncharacterized protein n=1 Tax=Aspergillus multicolor TaxID=41759 RepID=UPI003CCCAA77